MNHGLAVLSSILNPQFSRQLSILTVQRLPIEVRSSLYNCRTCSCVFCLINRPDQAMNHANRDCCRSLSGVGRPPHSPMAIGLPSASASRSS